MLSYFLLVCCARVRRIQICRVENIGMMVVIIIEQPSPPPLREHQIIIEMENKDSLVLHMLSTILTTENPLVFYPIFINHMHLYSRRDSCPPPATTKRMTTKIKTNHKILSKKPDFRPSSHPLHDKELVLPHESVMPKLPGARGIGLA